MRPLLAFRSFFLALFGLFSAFVVFPSVAQAYSLTGKPWAAGAVITIQMSLGQAPHALMDGNTSWNVAAVPSTRIWDQAFANFHFVTVMDSTLPVSSGDRVNSVTFSDSVFGQSFGSGVLAVTYYISTGANLVEADVLFNRAQTFDSYRGNLQFGSNGYAIADIRRVFLHELGHVLGLNHSPGDNIMNPTISNRESLSSDDIAAVQSMYGLPILAPPPGPASHLVNISTRMNVGVNDDALIGGFIVQGTSAKTILLRATGPSLAGALAGALANPTLDLVNSAGQTIASNDDWQSSPQAAQITASGLAPNNPLEPAIIAILAPGSYTAIVRGANNTAGIALVEGYELDTNDSRLVNLSTRGRIGTGDQVLIGGLIVRGASPKNLVVRALGPSLAAAVSGALANPALEIYDGNGAQIAANDDWQTSSQVSSIATSGLAPTSPFESCVMTSFAPGNYTAIVRGANNTTGVGLVEIYDLDH
ncbi:MAG: matrixin family metalloprotease [Chthoniobacterales bacterium]